MKHDPESRRTHDTHPVAVIGIGCRFPGGVNSPETFWKLLKSGIDAITEIPADRWARNAFYNPSLSNPGTMRIRHGGFIENFDRFDASFFGISPREAASMDPQQRLLLEVAWEALEDGGQVPEHLAGTKTGVFIGDFALDYKLLLLSEMQRDMIGPHATTGSFAAILANRISHWFDFRGASISIDTACSSSLIATHLACQSLWSGESDLALAGGVNVIFKPEWTIAISKGGFLSPEGRCKAFDEGGNGYVRSEGAGIVLLKPLPKALEDGDRIYAVIRSSASNQDGHTQGITVPSEASQIALLRKAYELAGVSPGQVQYVEAHGTGTAVGDPIEANAIGKVFSGSRPAGKDCILGSVKTNIGHLEAAAGVAGLIKAALCLYHSEIPPNLHFKTPNPKIPFEKLRLRVPTTVEPYPDYGASRLAGVNSFGFGGSNAHVVLEAADRFRKERPRIVDPQRDAILPLSARSEESLKNLVRSYRDLLKDTPSELSDICYSASLRRSHHRHRLAWVADSKEQLQEGLTAYLKGEKRRGMFAGGPTALRASKLAFVFAGMGPQWWAMGRQLLGEEPVFEAAVKRCDRLLKHHAPWSLKAELTADEAVSRMNETQIAQPAIFSIQVALAELWRSWGIQPDAILGHSVGEIAAAHVAGALSLEDAVRVIYHRSRLQHQKEGQGKMLAVGLPFEDAARILRGYESHVDIAAINSPNAVTMAGDAKVLEQIEQALVAQDIFCRFLKVNVPYHSPVMESLQPELIKSLEAIHPRSAAIPLFSTVTGRKIDGADLTPEYWADNIRNPVRFASSIRQLIREEYDIFLEVSAHPVLAGYVAECLAEEDRNGLILPSLRRQTSERATMLGSFANLYTRGFAVDWKCLYPQPGRFVQLPTYPWHQEQYWLESEESRNYRLGKAMRPVLMGQSVHSLLGSRFKAAHPIWDAQIDSQGDLRYLNDHQIQGGVIFPGAAFVEMALASARQIFDSAPYVLEDIEFREALYLSENDHRRRLQLILDPTQNIFDIYSKNKAQAWTHHATGKMMPAGKEFKSLSGIAVDEIKGRFTRTISKENFYLQLRKMGLEYGPSFQSIQEVWGGDHEMCGRLELPEEIVTEGYELHPAVLDACFQVFIAIVAFAVKDPGVYLPVRIDRLRVYGHSGQTLWGHARMLAQSPTGVKGDIRLIDESGKVLVEVKGFQCRALEITQDELFKELQGRLYGYRWESRPRHANENSVKAPGAWLIFADRGGIGQRIADRLQMRQEVPIMVTPGPVFDSTHTDHFQIRPASQPDMLSLIRIVGERRPVLRGVLHLWSLDTDRFEKSTPATLGEANKLGCISVLNLVKALSDCNRWPRLWVVTGDGQVVDESTESTSPAQAALWGLGRVIMNEQPELRTALIDIGQNRASEEIEALFAEFWNDDQEDEVALRNSSRYVHRLKRVTVEDFPHEEPHPLPVADRPFGLENSVPGTLSGLRLRPVQRKKPGDGEVEIQVYATALNFKDVAKAMNLLDHVNLEGNFGTGFLGLECAGKVVRVGQGVDKFHPGEDVCGFAPHSFSRFVTTDARLVVRKPPVLSFDEAAMLPLVFLTAYYGLYHLARMGANEKILIHAGAGGVGLAAIRLAQKKGAEIFATAGSPEKRKFLESIGVQHVMDSRSLTFADEVMEKTNGQGVDIVLNSLAGEVIPKSLALLGPYGRFVEIGKQDIDHNRKLGLRPFQNNLSFFAVDMDRLLKERPDFAGTVLEEMMEFMAKEEVPRLPCKVFPLSRIVDAFRFMAQAKQIGKIVIDMQDPHAVITPAVDEEVNFGEDGTYLITGGLSGFGLAVAEWLADHGGRHLALMGRSGASSPLARKSLHVLMKSGVEVHVAQADVTDPEQVADALADIRQSMPPLRGVIHAANVYDDSLLLKMDTERFQRVMAPKAMGAWNLHHQTLNDPLDFFVLFSSISSVVGNPGQGNYAAANAFLDALAKYRRTLHRPALTVNWGPVRDVGYVSRNSEIASHMKKIGIESLDSREALRALEDLLRLNAVNVTVAHVDWPKWAEFHKAGQAPRLAHLAASETDSGAAEPQLEFMEELKTAHLNMRRSVLEAQLMKVVAEVLGMRPSGEIAPDRSFSEMGMDSMLSVELRNRLQTSFACNLPTTLTFKYPHIEAIVDYFADEVLADLFSPKESEESRQATDTDFELADSLEELSQDEMAELLTQEIATIRQGK